MTAGRAVAVRNAVQDADGVALLPITPDYAESGGPDPPGSPVGHHLDRRRAPIEDANARMHR